MGKRPRLEQKYIGEFVVDELEYVENNGSKKARKLIDKTEQVYVEVWYDKHYMNRVQFGDDNGNKREGIGIDVVKDLVVNSLCHLIHYAFKISNFSFLNEVNHSGRALRMVLQRETELGLLNVVVGFYHIENNKYEVTVYTAMIEVDFKISDGQYVIFLNTKDSILLKMDNRSLVEVDNHCLFTD